MMTGFWMIGKRKVNANIDKVITNHTVLDNDKVPDTQTCLKQKGKYYA